MSFSSYSVVANTKETIKDCIFVLIHRFDGHKKRCKRYFPYFQNLRTLYPYSASVLLFLGNPCAKVSAPAMCKFVLTVQFSKQLLRGNNA